jgi:hypothetical protein
VPENVWWEVLRRIGRDTFSYRVINPTISRMRFKPFVPSGDATAAPHASHEIPNRAGRPGTFINSSQSIEYLMNID